MTDSDTTTARARREAREAAHAALDRLWKRHGWRRAEAYQWLSRKLAMPLDRCHIALMDPELCARVVVLVRSITKHELRPQPEGRRTKVERKIPAPRPPRKPPALPARRPRTLQEARDADDHEHLERRRVGR